MRIRVILLTLPFLANKNIKQDCTLVKVSDSNYFINIITQVRIAEADNTAQYWCNLGSQQSAIVIGPASPFATVKCWTDDDGLCRLFKFTDLQPKFGPVSTLYQADCHFYYIWKCQFDDP